MAAATAPGAGTDQSGKFRIYRFRDIPEAGGEMIDPQQTMASCSPDTIEGLTKVRAEGLSEGQSTKVLFQGAGMSILYVWFKNGFPLMRHSHNTDCLYHIIAGSIRLGTEDLGPGDGFFVPADTPYSYTVGPQGMEMLEFRTAESCDMRILSANAAYWARRAEAVRERVEGWKTEPKPSELTPA